jgi:hypothetical protein
MPLPAAIRVKLSSEDAGSISLTAVVVQDMPLAELVELMLGVTGKDATRIHELLLRGTLTSGATRFRWTGWDADPADLESLLSAFPDPDPSRPFSPQRCLLAVLRGPACRIEISREAGAARRLFRRRSFWDVLLETASAATLQYIEYSYPRRADRYRLDLTAPAADPLRRAATTLRYSALAAEVRRAAIHSIDFFVARAN